MTSCPTKASINGIKPRKKHVLYFSTWYFQKTKFNKAFYLDPIGGALYSVDRVEIEKEPEPIKTFDFYGDGYQ